MRVQVEEAKAGDYAKARLFDSYVAEGRIVRIDETVRGTRIVMASGARSLTVRPEQILEIHRQEAK